MLEAVDDCEAIMASSRVANVLSIKAIKTVAVEVSSFEKKTCRVGIVRSPNPALLIGRTQSCFQSPHQDEEQSAKLKSIVANE